MTPQTQTSGLGTKKWWVLAAICVLTFICYQRSLNNQFSDWDDDVYVTKDTIIQTLTPDHLKSIFTQDITRNNYHPFCMMSLAINYQFAKLKPATYYLTNILIHIANVILVFFLLTEFCKIIKLKEDDSFLIAILGALWFGVHPLHVESVSWIAERKDVLYTFFYLLGLISYIKHLKSSNKKWVWITFGLFVCSCLSKPMAVVFPLSLLALDYLYGRKIELKLLTQKTIFFLAAMAFGLFAVYTQNKAGAIADFNKLTIGERIMYASYGFDMYLYKLFNPSFLSTFYPYPYRYIDGSLPFIYYAAPFIALLVIIVPLVLTYKRNPFYFKVIAFGMGFFIANIIFVLQFISCGAAIMADRYSYVSSIGIIFITAFFVSELTKRFPSAKTALLTVVFALSAILSYACYERTAVWHNSETLLGDAIKKYPYRALLSYKWLGNYYMDKGDTDKALENYAVLGQLNAADAKIYDVLGNIYRNRNDYRDAMTYYAKAIESEKNVYITYVDRAVADAMAGDSTNCIKDYLQAFQLNGDAEKRLAETSFNMVQAQKNKPSILQYNALILLNPNNPFFFFYRGVAEFNAGNMDRSITDFKSALKFNSKDVFPNAAYNLAIAYDSIGNEQAALQFANAATQAGLAPKPGFIDKVQKKLEEKHSH
jgi:tetratricopeptide (TPR) repeat protein